MIEERWLRSVVSIRCSGRQGERHGTGFYVSEAGHVVTCLHVIDGAMTVEVREAYRPSARLYSKLCLSEADDLAVLGPVVPAPEPTAYLRVATESRPRLGATLLSFSNTHVFECAQQSTVDVTALSHRYGRLGIAASVDGGTSGSPVLDAEGRVVAVVQSRNGQHDREALAIGPERMRALVEQCIPTSSVRSQADAFLPGIAAARDRDPESYELLDRAWTSKEQRILVLRAIGGGGKSAMVKAWLLRKFESEELAPREVFTWTFEAVGPTQMATEHTFLSELGEFLGLERREVPVTPARLGDIAHACEQRRLLLILDAVEMLSLDRAGDASGTIARPVAALLQRLATGCRGLCVITSRIALPELERFGPPRVLTHLLPGLSTRGAIRLLRENGIVGDDAELARVADDCQGHPLALTLQARYAATFHCGSFAAAGGTAEFPRSFDAQRVAERMVQRYAEQLGPERSVLFAIAAFDDACNASVVRDLGVSAPRSALGRELARLSLAQWHEAVQRLVGLQLVSESEGPSHGPSLQCHVLVRDAVRARCLADAPDFWVEFNAFLSSDYAERAHTAASEEPRAYLDCRAVVHLSRAGRVTEAFRNIYQARIMKGREQHALKTLGMFSPVLFATQAMEEGTLAAPLGEDGAVLSSRDLLTVLGHQGTCMMALHGHTTPSLGDVLRRTQACARRCDDPTAEAYCKWLLHSHHLVRGELQLAEEAAGDLQSLASARGHDVAALLAAERLGVTRFYQGRFAEARALLGSVIDRLDSGAIGFELSDANMLDPQATCHVISALATCILGDEEAGRRHATSSLEHASRSGGALTQALVHLMVSRFHHLCEELDEALEHASSCMTLAERHDMVLWSALARVQRAGLEALTVKSPSVDLLDDALRGVAEYRAIGGGIALPYCLALAAQCAAKVGRPSACAPLLNEAIDTAMTTGEHWYLAEVLRLDAIQQRAGGAAGAEASWARAVDVAERQDAKQYASRIARNTST